MRKLSSVPMLLASFCQLPAAPSLTTVQDILYKADGTRFNGTITINWNNFQAGDASIVATQSLTLQIVNGVLKVQLVPTTNASPGANYQVNYTSAGRFQFTETWAVPPSSAALRVHDIRVSSGTTVGTAPVAGAQVQISDVSGLTNELLARPMRGVAYSPGRAAVINAAGQIDAAQGNLGDCVLVDGTSAPCGTAAGSTGYVDFDPSIAGLVNGSNATFVLSQTPSPAASLQLYRNGVLQSSASTAPSGLSGDYTLSGNTVTFFAASVPQSGDILSASYRTSSSGNIIGNQVAPNAPQVLCNGGGFTTASATQAILATCNIAANKLVAGDRVEIKFGISHQGISAGFNPSIYWGGTALMQRAMSSSDVAIAGEASIIIASNGTMSHFTSSAGSNGLPLMTYSPVTGTIQNINSIAFDGLLARTGTPDSVT